MTVVATPSEKAEGVIKKNQLDHVVCTVELVFYFLASGVVALKGIEACNIVILQTSRETNKQTNKHTQWKVRQIKKKID